jgi:hypothetical protein
VVKGLGNRLLGIPPGRPWWLVGAGLSLAGAALSTWYFFTGLLMFAGLYALWELGTIWRRPAEPRGSAEAEEKRRSSLRLAARGLAVAVLALVVLSPLVVALVRETATGADYTVTPERTVILNSADALALFVPFSARSSTETLNPHGSNPALGWTVLGLAVVGFAAGWRPGEGEPGRTARGHLWFWVAAALLFTLLAMGPHLLVGGSDTGWPMPYALLNKLPFIGAARVPLRFVLFVSLALAVLGAFGVAALLRGVRTLAARAVLLTALGLLVAVEIVRVPRELFTPSTHPFYAQIAASGGEGRPEAVMELPQSERSAPAMFDQSVHLRPIVGGYTARHYPYPWIGAAPGVPQLADTRRLGIDENDT